MEILGSVNGRIIQYVHADKDPAWQLKLPSHNWVAYVCGICGTAAELQKIITACIDKNVLYISSSGESSCLFQSLCEDEINSCMIKKLSANEQAMETGPLLSTQHDSISEGFFYATNLVILSGTEQIEKVVCLDFSSSEARNIIKEEIMKQTL